MDAVLFGKMNQVLDEVREGTIKKKFSGGVYASATPQKVVRAVSDNRISNLPIDNYGIYDKETNSSTFGTYSYNTEFELTNEKVASFIVKGNYSADLTTPKIELYILENNNGQLTEISHQLILNAPTNHEYYWYVQELSVGKYMIFYMTNDIGATINNKMSAFIVTINTITNEVVIGNVLSAFCDYTLQSVPYLPTEIVALDDSNVIFMYSDKANSFYTTCIALTVNGTTITAGTKVALKTINTSKKHVLALSSTTAVVLHRDSATSTVAFILTRSGTTITKGADITIATFDPFDIALHKIDINYFLAFAGTNVYKCTSSGSTITLQNSLTGGQMGYTPDRRFSMLHKINDNGLYMHNNVGYTNNSKFINIGSTQSATMTIYSSNFMSGMTQNSYPIIMQHTAEKNKFFVYANDSSNRLNTRYIIIDETTLSMQQYTVSQGTVFNFNSNIDACSAKKLRTFSNYALVPMKDWSSTSMVTWLIKPIDLIISQYGNQVVGILQSDGYVVMQGVSKGHSNLVIGTTYYYDSNGNITTSGTKLGKAISTTEIYLDKLITPLIS